jgi:hypothetical protein
MLELVYWMMRRSGMFKVSQAKSMPRSAGTPGRQYDRRSRVHVFVENETMLENLTDRRNRPSKLYRKIVEDQFPTLAGQITWSQKAGCGCGCSPGFITSETIRDEHFRPLDFYITAAIG